MGRGKDGGLPSFFDARTSPKGRFGSERESGARLGLPQGEESLVLRITSQEGILSSFARSWPTPSLRRPAGQHRSTDAAAALPCSPLCGLLSRPGAFRLRGARQVRRVLPHTRPLPWIAATAALGHRVLRRAWLSLCGCKGSLLLESPRWVLEEMAERRRRLQSSCPWRRFLTELLWVHLLRLDRLVMPEKLAKMNPGRICRSRRAAA